MATQIQLRNDTATNWASSNPVLARGEMGCEYDTAKYKIGDGTTAWNSLVYGGINSGTFTNPNFIAITEKVNIVGAAFATGTNNLDALTASVWYYNVNSTASGTLNIRGNSSTTLSSILATGASLTVVAILQNGATAYLPATIQVDGTTVTPKWMGGSAPSAGNASANDIYTFTITKTASAPTYVVFASVTKYSA